MILIFDLDDTLYTEIDYVRSGFLAVSQYLQSYCDLDQNYCYMRMNQILLESGRGHVFDKLLSECGLDKKSLIRKCLSVYRCHDPKISLNDDAKKLLPILKGPNFLVTDGNRLVQKKKIEALQVKNYFEKIYITHRYGLHRAKPSTYCFDLIRRSVDCNWRDMVYVGDNPSKDFVNIKTLGIKTIRVLTGEYATMKAKKSFDAEIHISRLSDLTKHLNLEMR